VKHKNFLTVAFDVPGNSYCKKTHEKRIQMRSLTSRAQGTGGDFFTEIQRVRLKFPKFVSKERRLPEN